MLIIALYILQARCYTVYCTWYEPSCEKAQTRRRTLSLCERRSVKLDYKTSVYYGVIFGVRNLGDCRCLLGFCGTVFSAFRRQMFVPETGHIGVWAY